MRFLIFLFFVSFSGLAQTVLVDHSSEDSQDLWSMGAADLMSFYLQEQGVEVVHRGQLDSMINELSIADAEIAKSDIRKGKWRGTEFIINGSVVTDSKGFFLKISLSRSRTATQLHSFQKHYADKDNLATEVENQSRIIGHLINKLGDQEKTDSQQKTNELFHGVNALSLMTYYRAAQLIQEGREGEGIAEFIYLTQNAPSFELPYYWLINFFKKYDMPSLAEAYMKLLSVESLKNSQVADENFKGIVVNASKEISSHDLKELYQLLKKHNYQVISSKRAEKREQENDLSKWGMLSAQHRKIFHYGSSYIIYLSKKNQNIMVQINRSRDGKKLLYMDYSSLRQDNFSKLIEILQNKAQSSKNDIKDNSSKESHIKGSYRNKKEFLADIFKDLSQGLNKEKNLYILIKHFSDEFGSHHDKLWSELFRVESDLAFYYKSEYLYKNTN